MFYRHFDKEIFARVEATDMLVVGVYWNLDKNKKVSGTGYVLQIFFFPNYLGNVGFPVNILQIQKESSRRKTDKWKPKRQ